MRAFAARALVRRATTKAEPSKRQDGTGGLLYSPQVYFSYGMVDVNGAGGEKERGARCAAYSTSLAVSAVVYLPLAPSEAAFLRAMRDLRSLSIFSLVMMTLDGWMPTLTTAPGRKFIERGASEYKGQLKQ